MQVRGVDRVRKLLRETPRAADERIAEDLQDWCNQFLVPAIRRNTPIKTGRTRESIHANTPVVRSHKVSLSIDATTPQALRLHEEEYNLGPISARQPPTPEGGVGNKYITRTLRYHARSLRLLLGASLRTTIRKLYPSGAVRTLR